MRIDGTWRLALDLPAGYREGTVRLTAVGRSLSGSWHGAADSRLFDGGPLLDSAASWTVETPGSSGPMRMNFDAVVEGETMSGTVEVCDEAGLLRGERISQGTTK
jgi:hypothetical protein